MRGNSLLRDTIEDHEKEKQGLESKRIQLMVDHKDGGKRKF